MLLVHGFFGTKEERGLFDAITRVLTGGGLAVFRFDFFPAFMGEGYNPRGVSSRHTSLGTRCDIGPHFFADAAGHGMVERMRRWNSRLLHEVALPPKELLLLPGSSHTPRHPSLYEALPRWYGPGKVSKDSFFDLTHFSEARGRG